MPNFSKILNKPELTVAHLYADLAMQRTEQVKAELDNVDTETLFADGAAALEVAAAVLQYTARLFAVAGPDKPAEMHEMADSLVAIAANFEAASCRARLRAPREVVEEPGFEM
jgi:predicted naringenin-chalcone synthase